MRRPQHHAKPAITRAQAEAALATFLYGCRPGALGGLDAAMLTRWYNVSEATAQGALDKARSVRGALV